jgi:glycosyltransferase involved in cell wall biosynthesis
MSAVDIVIHPSVEPEPFGRTLIEAMLVGRPVIATDAGASTEILAGGSVGALVQAGNDQALADAVLRVLTEDAAREDQLKEARHRAHSLYDVDVMRSAILDKINRVAKEARQ